MRVMTSQLKQAAKFIFTQSKSRTQNIIYPPEKKKFGTSSILARGKSRVLPTNHLFTLCCLLFIVLFAKNCTNQIKSNYLNSHGEEAQEKPLGL